MALASSGAPRTRRAILAGALGGVTAWAVSALGRPGAVGAHDPDDVLLGGSNTAADTTVIATAAGTAIMGETSAVDASGVYGKATATSGNTAGVTGWTASPDGRGVVGNATGAVAGIGVLGEATGHEGVGVMGVAEASSSSTSGVFGISTSNEGYGVRGSADATDGNTSGVLGTCESPSGVGVSGISQAATGGTGVSGQSEGTGGAGVWGTGDAYGVWGDSSGVGVFGHTGDKTGVLGFAGLIDMGVPPPDAAAKTGVYGYSILDSASVGVLGRTTTGKGVRGEATTGVGGSFSATSGIALDVSGKARFSRAKRVTIPSGAALLTVHLAGVTTASLVLATLQTNRVGIHVQAVVPTTGAFTIRLNKAVSSATGVAYFVIN